MKRIFEYFDYQKFLRDYYEEKKRDNPYISFRFLGNHMNLDPGFLLKVIQGKHHLAKRSIAPVCAFFKFSEREARYFDVLVSYNKAKTASDIKLYFEKLMTLRELDAGLWRSGNMHFTRDGITALSMRFFQFMNFVAVTRNLLL